MGPTPLAFGHPNSCAFEQVDRAMMNVELLLAVRETIMTVANWRLLPESLP
jgi:hypothetical protein